MMIDVDVALGFFDFTHFLLLFGERMRCSWICSCPPDGFESFLVDLIGFRLKSCQLSKFVRCILLRQSVIFTTNLSLIRFSMTRTQNRALGFRTGTREFCIHYFRLLYWIIPCEFVGKTEPVCVRIGSQNRVLDHLVQIVLHQSWRGCILRQIRNVDVTFSLVLGLSLFLSRRLIRLPLDLFSELLQPQNGCQLEYPYILTESTKVEILSSADFFY